MPYASWNRRATAFVLDLSLLFSLAAIGFLANLYIDGATGTVVAIAFYCAALLVNFYNKCVRLGRIGMSWGKQAMSFSLLSDVTHRPFGWFKALVREFAHAADVLTLGIGWIMPFWDKKRQTLADKIMKTAAIDNAWLDSQAGLQVSTTIGRSPSVQG